MWHLIAHFPFPTSTPDRDGSKRARSCTVGGGIPPKRLINPTYLADGRVGRPKLLFAAFCIIFNSVFSLLVITTGEKEFSLLPNRTYPPLGPTYPPTQWVPAFFPGDKAALAWNWPLNLEPRPRMSGAIPLLPLCAFKASAGTTLWRF